MIEKLKQILEVSEETLTTISRSKRRLKDLQSDYKILSEKQRLFYNSLQKENKDVEKIIGVSIASFVATLMSNRDEKIEKEEFEAIEAKRLYDTITDELESIGTDIESLKRIILQEPEIKRQYEKAFEEKKAYVLQSNPSMWAYIEEQSKVISTYDLELKEINEALSAATLVKGSVESALRELNKAKNLGVFDMLGGGLLITMAKRSHMNTAQSVINQMNQHLKSFSRELKDVDQYTTSTIEIGQFMSFADYFFDGLFMDIFVQNKINDTISKIETVQNDIRKVTNVLTALKSEKTNKKSAIQLEIKKRIRNS